MKVIEFLGMARAGKTTQIDLLKKHLQKQGFKVAVLTDRERASSFATSPTEGLAYTLVFFAAVIEAYYKHKDKVDYLLVDRGVYDVPVWADVRRNFKEISVAENQALKNVFKRFTNFVDTVIFFENAIDSSLDRHTKTKQEVVDEVAMNKLWLTVLANSYKKNKRPTKKTLRVNGQDSKVIAHQEIINFLKKI